MIKGRIIAMEGREHWNVYFKDYKYPCFITKKDTEELVYCNDEFKKIVEHSDEKIGRNIFDVVKKNEVHITNTNPNWDEIENFEAESYNKRTHRRFTLKFTKMEGGEEILCEMVPKENSLYDNLLFEKAIAKCNNILEGEKDKVYTELMRLIAQFYKGERAYIYKFDLNKGTVNCLAQWSENTNFSIKHIKEPALDTNKFVKWLQENNNAGVLSANNRQVLDSGSEEAKLLEGYKLRNITLCNIEDANHKVIGVIGISNRSEEVNNFDRRLVHTVSGLVAKEVAKEKEMADLFELHHRDLLTGCYNRTGYAKVIDAIMSQKPETLGVISVNVNGLRHINELYGIEQGDIHIQKSAKRLQEYFGVDIFRMSGHEFLGVVPNVTEKEFESQVMELHGQMREEQNFDFSLGHTWSNSDFNVMRLSHKAEKVMYINKQQYYSEARRTSESMKNAALIELLQQIENDEFMLYLQPQVWLKDGSLYGAEALVRTYDKEINEMVFPDKFIPIYEDKSVIRHLDMFVLESVCKLQKQWIEAGKRIPISVNFSRVTLQEYGIVDAIVEMCNKYEIPHELVVIEITERVGLVNNSVASVLVQQFKENGFNLSLDDFGCANSNIITLAQIEVDEIKIDKSLVDFILSNEKNRMLVKGILDMCDDLQGTSTLAEGIETQEQNDLLHQLGCGLGQGYHYSRPIPIPEFEEKYIR